MVLTDSLAKVQGQWSVGSEDRVETNGRTEAIASPSLLMWWVMIEGGSFDGSTGRRHACDNTRNEPGPQLGAGGVISDSCWCQVWSHS